MAGGEERPLLLEDVEALLASKAFVVDACRHVVRNGGTVISLAKRPVLFALARALGEAWPGDVARDTLVARAFGARVADESHRARLRVEIGRLRAMVRPLAAVSATKRGFKLAPRRAREVVVLARPIEISAGARGRARPSRGRRVVVELGHRGGAWSEPANSAAGARFTGRSRRSAAGWSRAGAPLDDSARAWIHDDFVTPRSPAYWLGWNHESINCGDCS